MGKYIALIVLAVLLPPWVIGFVVIGIPVLLFLFFVFGGGAYYLIRGAGKIFLGE